MANTRKNDTTAQVAEASLGGPVTESKLIYRNKLRIRFILKLSRGGVEKEGEAK